MPAPRKATRGLPLDLFPLATYPKGAPLLGEVVEIPLGADYFEARIDRNTLPALELDANGKAIDVASVMHEISLDGGAHWVAWGAYTLAGGVAVDPLGNVAEYSAVPLEIPEPNNPARLLRTTVVPLKDIRTRHSVACWRTGEKVPGAGRNL